MNRSGVRFPKAAPQEDVVGALADVFTWTGFGGAVLCGLVALVLFVADGTWLPVRAVVEAVDGGHVVRWIDDAGGVNEAPVGQHDVARIGGRDMADVYYRRGWRNRMRLTRRSPAVRLAAWLALGCAGIGVLAQIASLVLLAVQG